MGIRRRNSPTKPPTNMPESSAVDMPMFFSAHMSGVRLGLLVVEVVASDGSKIQPFTAMPATFGALDGSAAVNVPLDGGWPDIWTVMSRVCSDVHPYKWP